MSHGHHHHHDHSGGERSKNRKRLTITLVLVLVYMFAELIGGLLTGSLALLADAGHMFSDAASLGLALFATWIAGKPSTSEHTWGYHRTEILAALVNGAMLVAISFYIFYEAYLRLQQTPEVQGDLMILIAVGGLCINLAGLYMLKGGREESLNVQGAWLHVLADTLGSVQVIVAGLLIWLFAWNWADPVASILIGVLIIVSSWNLLQESVMVLLESSPGHLDVDEVRTSMNEIEHVTEVHDLHIWTITSGLVALSAHVVCESSCNRDIVLARLKRTLENRFNISHVTIQLESTEYDEPRPTL